MTDVDRLLEEFIAADRAGVADPAEYLARVDGRDRAELEALIDGYLARAPRRAFDRAAFEASPAAGVVASLAGSSGTWPALLPRLRDRARLSAPSWSRGWPRSSASAAARRRSRPTTTRWSRARCRRRASATACSRRWGGSSGESAAVLRAAGTLAPPPAAGACRVRAGRVPRAGVRGRGAAPPSVAEPPARDEVDELFTGGA